MGPDTDVLMQDLSRRLCCVGVGVEISAHWIRVGS